jgi:stage V sporulation protein AC
MPNDKYIEFATKFEPKSKLFANCIKAFLIGGFICCIGQAVMLIAERLGAAEDNIGAITSVAMILLSIILTSLHLYNKLAKHAGAGTLVPITGFANSVASAAIEFVPEGRITGTGVKMFIIAGPVLVYGTATAFICGLIYYAIERFSGRL